MQLITIYHNQDNLNNNAMSYLNVYYGWSSTRRLRVRTLDIKTLPAGVFTRIIRNN